MKGKFIRDGQGGVEFIPDKTSNEPSLEEINESLKSISEKLQEIYKAVNINVLTQAGLMTREYALEMMFPIKEKESDEFK